MIFLMLLFFWNLVAGFNIRYRIKMGEYTTCFYAHTQVEEKSKE
jgi:predicted secreted protein